MSKQTILTIFFSVSINQANNFEKIALVIYNNKEYKRFNPNELVIVNDSLRIFKGIDMNNKKVLFKTKDGQDNSIISFEKIRTLRYQKKSLQLRTTGAIVGSAIYAVWGYLQSSNSYENYGEENGQKNNILIFTIGASAVGGVLGYTISYPFQVLYNSWKPIWSENIIIDKSNWRIL